VIEPHVISSGPHGHVFQIEPGVAGLVSLVFPLLSVRASENRSFTNRGNRSSSTTKSNRNQVTPFFFAVSEWRTYVPSNRSAA